jgi:hypothetical protein
MGFDFTIAITPSEINLDKELQYIKSALFYADTITLISPVAYLYTQLTNEENQLNERTGIKLINLMMPYIKAVDPNFYDEATTIISKMQSFVTSNKYKNIPMSVKIELRKQLRECAKEIDKVMTESIGNDSCTEISKLLQSKNLLLKKFEHSLGDVEGSVPEFFHMLKDSIKFSYPLFDEVSSNLMKAAVREKIITLSDIDKQKLTHAGLSDNLIQKLPSFDLAKVDEILDIKKELSNPLIRFQSKVLSYSETIQSVPWDDDFETECLLLYAKDVAPALLDIEEMSKDSGFLRNLGKSLVTDESFLKSASGLIVEIAAAGVLASFSDVVSADKAILATGGAWAISKVASAYNSYKETKKEISKKDLYFYYAAGEKLSKTN